MSSSPNFASIAQIATITQLSVANTNRDGTGTLGTLLTGTASGTIVEQITIKATGTTTQGMIRFFLSVDGGTNKRLIDEVIVGALTPSGTAQAFYAIAPNLAGLLLLTTNSILYAATNNAETFNVITQNSGL
ncbi:MAG: hypothetical protein EB116_12075 [Betaproteobacteria bacterium]|nr:hypothetical protein [Betaproteobacteria bacterium]